MIRKIITYPAPLLERTSKPVEAVDDEVRTLLDDMVETMYAGDGVGLAAPQVAVGLRAIVIDIGAGSEAESSSPLKMVNPEIISRDGEIEREEGCLSVPDFRVVMKRSKSVTVRYLDENGRAKELALENLPAAIVQHEIDHLDGILIIDAVSRLKRDMYVKRTANKKETTAF